MLINTTLTLSKRYFRDLWKKFLNILEVSMLLFRSRCQSIINLQSMLPQWENIFNLRKYMYQVPACLELSWWYSVQCLTITISKSNSVFIAASQTKKQRSHASCINISCYLILLWLVVLKFYMQTIFNSNFHLDAKRNDTILLMINIKMISSHMYWTAYCYYLHTQFNILQPSTYTVRTSIRIILINEQRHQKEQPKPFKNKMKICRLDQSSLN